MSIEKKEIHMDIVVNQQIIEQLITSNIWEFL